MKNTCVLPGTFDPVTVGHYDVILRASKMFDQIYVTVFDNTAKNTMFTPNQRFEMLKISCKNIPNAHVDITNMLLIEYAQKKSVHTVIKGVRNMIDFDYEYQLSMINHELSDDVETIFLPAKSEHMYISSTFVREMLIYKKDISRYVPAGVDMYINTL